jgi:pyruvate dehydrogenase E2 component (dihydrolipoamide acetyltransferase)
MGQTLDTGPERLRIPQSRMRRAVAERMSASKRDIPHFYVSTEIEVDKLGARLAAVEHEQGVKVTLTAALIRALASVLPTHPWLNAHWTREGHELIRAINIGVAIPVEDGLIAPAILGCDHLGLVETANALSDLVERARAMRLRAAELSEATFTISNLVGMIT